METFNLRGSSKNPNSILLSLWISCSSSLSIPKFSSYSSSAVVLCLAILANISQTLDGLTEIVNINSQMSPTMEYKSPPVGLSSISSHACPLWWFE